jgi:ABC-type transport system involved in multi-copper enzyme maturation permease subunit
MQSMIRAEWQKTTGNRWVVGSMLLIFPVMAVIVVLITTLIAAGGRPAALARIGIPGPGQVAYWPDFFLYFLTVPDTAIGRWLLIAFAAVVFAGEYQWRTWKGLLIRRQRWSLVLVKFMTVALLILSVFFVASLILGLGMALPIRVTGGSYGPGVTGKVLGGFLVDYALRMGLVLLSALLATAYAALAALATRSILGSLLVGIGVFMLEEALPGLLGLIGTLLHRPEIITLHRFAPAYNLQNLLIWRLSGEGYTYPALSRYAEPNSPVLSLAILGLWLALLIGLAVAAFNRQDISG